VLIDSLDEQVFRILTTKPVDDDKFWPNTAARQTFQNCYEGESKLETRIRFRFNNLGLYSLLQPMIRSVLSSFQNSSVKWEDCRWQKKIGVRKIGRWRK
jgi:hypothetical protein